MIGNQRYETGKWACTITYPTVGKSTNIKSIKTTVVIYYDGQNVFQTTGLLAYESAKEQVDRWQASGYVPAPPKTKCLADYSPAARITVGAMRDNEKKKSYPKTEYR